MDVFQFIGFLGLIVMVFGFTRHYYIQEGYEEGIQEGDRYAHEFHRLEKELAKELRDKKITLEDMNISLNHLKPRSYEGKKADDKSYRSKYKTVGDIQRQVEESTQVSETQKDIS